MSIHSNKVNELKESLFKREDVKVDGDILSYGTFEVEFEEFRMENLRVSGINVEELNYLSLKSKQLNDIEIMLIGLERDFGREYTAIHKLIQECRQEIRRQIEVGEKVAAHSSRRKGVPINLNYFDRIEEAVKIIYKGLHPLFIEIGEEEFSSHFHYSEHGLKKIKWKGSEAAIVDLFLNQVSSLNNHIDIIVNHFVNKKDGSFSKRQLGTVAERTKGQYRNCELIKNLGMVLSNL